MLISALLVIFFWGVVPGLITGWMLRERGRRFLPGLILGAVGGPLGILGALAFIYVSDRRRTRDRQHVRGHAVRVFYEIPVVGRLHVSTVWALAGLATFLCLWMIGGIVYEFYRAEPGPQESPEQSRRNEAEARRDGALHETGPGTRQQSAETKLGAQAQANTSAQARSALVGNLSPPAGQTPPGGARPDNASTGWQPPQPGAGGAALPAPQQETPATGTVLPPAPATVPPAQPAKAAAQARADAVAEVTRDLASRGHRVHTALSGDTQTATLSLTGATLTRAAGNQLLGNGRLRGALKAAGVRIVVLLNGEESWTYIL
jgi:cytoskeletal protein RodZ